MVGWVVAEWLLEFNSIPFAVVVFYIRTAFLIIVSAWGSVWEQNNIMLEFDDCTAINEQMPAIILGIKMSGGFIFEMLNVSS